VLTGLKRPFIELSDCVLCDICTDYCPEAFRMNEAGFVEVVNLDEYPEKDVNEVIKTCRGDCISWEEL